MEISTVLTQMTILFILLAVGYLAAKLKVLDQNGSRVLTSLVMNITMPCMIVNAVLGEDIQISGGDTLRFLLFAVLAFGLMFLMGLGVPQLLRAPKTDAGVYRFMILFSNVGFMGFPVLQALYGGEALFYGSIYNIVFNVLLFSVGVAYISGGWGALDLKKVVSPAMIATLLAVVLYITGAKLPEVILSPIQFLGNVTTPVAMLVVGITLAGMPLREVFNDWRVYPLSAISLLVVPVVTWAVFRLFVQDALSLGVLVLLAAMPGASAATMLCLQYGGNDRLASKAVFITTLLSVVTVPVLAYFLL